MVDSKGRQATVVKFEPRVASSNPFQVPATGKECIRVTLNFANAAAEQWTAPTFEITVVDRNGQKYDSLSFDCASGDKIDGLVAGGRAQARLTFEVPKGTQLNLSWQPNQFEPEVHQTVLR